jgi:hypothetical protein
MAINRSSQQKQLVPGLNVLFGEQYKAYEPQHTQFYETSTSKRAFEEDVKVALLGNARVKDEGASVSYDDGMGEAFTARYDHVTIALGFRITEEAVEDNLYVSVGQRGTKALARAMANTKQVRAVDPINRGFTTYNSGDGVPLFSTAHPTVSGAVNANRPATGQDLNETSLEAADIAIGAWVDERGLLIRALAKRLIVPNALKYVAKRILGSDLRVGTSDNDINALRSMGTYGNDMSINNFLTDTNSWYIKTDVPNALRHFERAAVKTSNEGDFDTGNFKYKARERYSFGVSDPLGIYGSPGSS